MQFWQSLRRGRADAAARALYESVVAQARRPGFFAAHGVPDTLDGRFEMIALHAHLVLRRLGKDARKPESSKLAQALFDLMFADMDQSLREMGVGDLSVGRKIRGMAEAYYGRAAAYDAGLNGGDGLLAAALRRNLYGTVEPEETAVAAMAEYVRRQDAHLSGQPAAALGQGRIDFLPAPAAPAPLVKETG